MYILKAKVIKEFQEEFLLSEEQRVELPVTAYTEQKRWLMWWEDTGCDDPRFTGWTKIELTIEWRL